MMIKKIRKFAGTKTNLSHGEFLFGSLQILIQRVDGLLMLLCGSGHLLSFFSEGSNLCPVALNIVLKHLIPDEVDILFSGLCSLLNIFQHIKCSVKQKVYQTNLPFRGKL